jgi:hypothetical protein
MAREMEKTKGVLSSARFCIFGGGLLQDQPTPVLRLVVPKLAVQERYNLGVFSSVLAGSLQGIAERPLPCNYNVIQFVCALSRR